MSNILLSIIIPTYNGGDFLKENLENLIPMLQQYKDDDLEFIVSNNASDDDTEETIIRWMEKLPSLRYIKRNETLGAMEHFETAVAQSKGQFVFLLGDDDILVPGAINVIMDILHKYHNISALHFNRLDYIMSKNNIELFNGNSAYPIVNYYSNIGEFIKHHATMDSMSTVIFRKDCWAKLSKDKEDRYWGYVWYARLLNGITDKKMPAVYYGVPLLIQRHPPVRKWSAKRPLYLAGLLNVYKDLDEKINGVYYYYNSYYPANSNMFFLSIQNIIAENKRMYKDYADQLYKHNPQLWRRIYLTLSIYILPPIMMRGLVICGKAFNKMHSLIKS